MTTTKQSTTKLAKPVKAKVQGQAATPPEVASQPADTIDEAMPTLPAEALAALEVPAAQQPEPTHAPQSLPRKHQRVLEMLQRGEGASLDELSQMGNWLPHSTRALLSGLKKKGYALTSDKVDGVRRYFVASDAEASGPDTADASDKPA